MNKKATILISIISVTMLFAMQFMVEPVAAQVTYQDITGKLGGAEYLIRIPSNWQGGLVVMCIGYTPHPLSPLNLIYLELMYANGFAWITNMGYALVMSNYGEEGWCVSKGIIRTHQLTEYVIDNYEVTGKVYLLGLSMGGEISLLLGTKYPNLYDGVLEAAGVNDLVDLYPLVLPTTATDIELECGGTPEEKPKAYERISPIFSALDIAVPTITVHGDADTEVPYAQALAYFNAVTQTGHSELYRLYRAPGAGHMGTKIGIAIVGGFSKLVAWVEGGTPAPLSTP